MKQLCMMIVDDNETNRVILKKLFQDKYTFIEKQDGREGLEFLREAKTMPDVMLLDVFMPTMDGIEMLTIMKEEGYTERVPVILITADQTSEVKKHAYDYGVYDVIAKPFDAHIVRKRVSNIVELCQKTRRLEQTVEEQDARIEDMKCRLVDTLSAVMEFRNVESGRHILRIRQITKVILEYIMTYYHNDVNLTEKDVNLISRAVALHDIGKIAIPESILFKPGKLTEDEFEYMKMHTIKGCEILESVDLIDDQEYMNYCYQICKSHHEKYDGHGYPEQLKGDEIPLAAQVAGLADVYDSLVSDRVYKAAYTPEKAYDMIVNGECGTFSPMLNECLKKAKLRLEAIVAV